MLSKPYVALDDEWVEYVNRQAPLGNEKWQVEIATKYGMICTLNERGRPRKDI
jgi:hypothetical protein